MKHVLVIGIGSGDPEHLTVQAINAMNACDVLFVIAKPGAHDELADIRREIIDLYVDRPDKVVTVEDAVRDRTTPAYREAVDAWREGRADLWQAALDASLDDGRLGGFLVWGDPAFYDSTVAVLDTLIARGADLDFEVIPGISAIQALAAEHRIGLNQVGGAVQITPGRLLRENGWPAGVDDVVVMLDAQGAYRDVEVDGDIYWGAYVSDGAEQILIAGPADATTFDSIEAARAEARERRGWVMDSYLLRRRRRTDGVSI